MAAFPQNCAPPFSAEALLSNRTLPLLLLLLMLFDGHAPAAAILIADILVRFEGFLTQ